MSAATILSLALPALGVLAAPPLYLLLDTAVVGQLGATDLAALGAGTTVQSMVTTQLTFLSYGTTARAARLFGAGQRSRAIAEGVQATWVAWGVGVAIALAVIGWAPQLMQALTGNAEVAAEAARWIRIAALGVPLVLITMAGNGWLRGIQNTRAPLLFTLAGIIPGALAIPLLVGRYGIVGSAYANLLGIAITSTCFITMLWRSHSGSWRPSWSIIRRQLLLGRDLIVRSLSLQVSFLSAAAVAARFGTAELAAHQVLLQLWNFLTLVLDSLAIAAQTLVGAALGRGSVAVARRVGRAVVRYSLGFGAVLAAVFALAYRVLPPLFTNDPAVLAAIRGPYLLLLGMIVVGSVVFALDGVLLGASDAAFLRTITVGAAVIGFLPGVWLSYLYDGGLVGVWGGLVAFIVLRLCAVMWRFLSMRWARVGAE